MHDYLITAKLSTPTRGLDWASMLAAQRLLLEVAAQPAIARHGADTCQAPAPDSDADLRAIARTASTTRSVRARSGRVVDAELRVRGVAGLRVVDPSMMPSVPRGNTNAGAIMIGEKAADLLVGRTAAAPHEVAAPAA